MKKKFFLHELLVGGKLPQNKYSYLRTNKLWVRVAGFYLFKELLIFAEIKRKVFHLLVHSTNGCLANLKLVARNFWVGLPCGFRIPRTWATLRCFPKSLAGSCNRAGAGRTPSGAHTRCQCHIRVTLLHHLCCPTPLSWC